MKKTIVLMIAALVGTMTVKAQTAYNMIVKGTNGEVLFTVPADQVEDVTFEEAQAPVLEETDAMKYYKSLAGDYTFMMACFQANGPVQGSATISLPAEDSEDFGTYLYLNIPTFMTWAQHEYPAFFKLKYAYTEGEDKGTLSLLSAYQWPLCEQEFIESKPVNMAYFDYTGLQKDNEETGHRYIFAVDASTYGSKEYSVEWKGDAETKTVSTTKFSWRNQINVIASINNPYNPVNYEDVGVIDMIDQIMLNKVTE